MGSGDGHPRPTGSRLLPRGRHVAVTTLALLVVAVLALATLDLTGRLPGGVVADPEPTPTPVRRLDPRPVEAPAVLAAEPTAPAAVPPVAPVAALDRVLVSGPLGPDPGAVVLDVASGSVLMDRGGDRPRTPASVTKLVTGAAALHAFDPGSRLETRVVAGAVAGEVVLVGAGDATLTTRPARAYPQRASLVELAEAAAATLGNTGQATPVTVRVDDSLFAGPPVAADWPASYVGSGEVAPVSALSVDGGRVRPGDVAREPDPALAAGRELARLLGRRGVAVAGEVSRSTAPAGAPVIASVSSPTVGELVELMLEESDDDLAESLLRLVAVAAGRPGSFDEGTTAVVDALSALGLATEGAVLRDGSGLARTNLLAPETLGRLLGLAADGSQPRLGHLVTGLPIAGFTGTLSLRFGAGGPGDAAGLVRAKTGTLTGVSTLAGVASLGGRPVVFVVMADGVPGDTLAARDALDRFAAVLARS